MSVLSVGNDSAFESMFCQYVNQYYAFVKSNADAILNLIPFALSKLQTVLGIAERTVNQVIRESIEQVADLVASLTDIFCGMNLSSAIGDLCELLQRCQALVMLLSGNAPLSPFPPLAIGGLDLGSTYENFQKTVCFLNPMNIASAVQEQLLNQVQGLMDGLRELNNGVIQKIEDIKQIYWDALINAKIFGYNIFDVLQMLEMFFECAMGLCDYTGQAPQDINEMMRKARLTKLDGIYFLDLGEQEAKIREAVSEHTSKINILEGIVNENGFRFSVDKLSSDIKNDPNNYPTIGSVSDSINSIINDTNVDSTSEVVGKVWSVVAEFTTNYEQRPCADGLSGAIKCSSVLEF